MAELAFVPRSFKVTLPVYPGIPMVQSSALALATKLASKLSLTDIHMSDELWEYRRPQATEGQPRGLVRVVVRDNQIQIEHQFPATGLEQFERLVEQVTSSFEDPFAPDLAFAINVELDYVVDLVADARQSLLGGLRLFNEDTPPNKIDVFNRPCHLVGLRLGFPPYDVIEEEPPGEPEVPGETAEESSSRGQPTKGADWQAIVTILTLEDSPGKISVEIDGTWPGPYPWPKIYSTIENRLQTASDFLRNQIRDFLEHFKGDSDENSD